MKRRFKMAEHLFNTNAYIIAENLLQFEYKLLYSLYDNKGEGNAARQYAIYSLSYYVSTGRAYYDWCVAFSKATPEKLLNYIIKHSNGYVGENLKAAETRQNKAGRRKSQDFQNKERGN